MQPVNSSISFSDSPEKQGIGYFGAGILKGDALQQQKIMYSRFDTMSRLEQLSLKRQNSDKEKKK